MASSLSHRGVGPGDAVMLVGRTSVDLIAAIRAGWLLGAPVVVAPVPGSARSSAPAAERLRVVAAATAPRVVLGDGEFLALLGDRGDGFERLAFDQLSGGGHLPPLPADVSEESDAILQPTSGTTQEPRIVRVPRRCLLANLGSIRGRLRFDPADDRIVSWLPLSHDMGLVGVLGSAMAWGIDLVIADPSLYAGDPSLWMKWCSDYGGTITVAPNFAYALAERQLSTVSREFDLAGLRVALNGAEPIDVDVFGKFLAAGARHQVTPASAMCVYGLAEATLAVTFPDLGAGLEVDQPGGVGHRPESQRFAFLGTPLDGVEIRISSPIPTELEDRDVGEIEIRGTSVTPGYLGESPVRSSRDWLSSGDLGYIHRGQLVVCGRSKDVIIHGGRNIFPEQVESVISTVDGVREGSVVVFGVRGRSSESVVAVVESVAGDDRRMQRDIAAAVLDHCEVALATVRLVPPGTLPKTTSGKLARARTRTMFEEGTF